MFRDFVFVIIDLINLLIPVLSGLAVLLFLVGMVLFISKAGDVKRRGSERQAMLWGLVALFVLFSIWGILRVLDESFFGITGRPPSSNEPIDLRPDYMR